MRNFSKKIAVVGYGYWGQKLATACEKAGLEVVVVDSMKIPTEKYSQLDWETVLGDASIVGVIIATPEKTHAALILAALGAHKAVLVEKPATTTAESWKNCVELAKKNQLSLMVDYTFLYSQALQRWLELSGQYRVQLGVLEKLITTRKASLSQTRITGKGLPIWWDVAIHDLYLWRAIYAAQPDDWKVLSAALPSQIAASATLKTAVVVADYSWMANSERSWLAEYAQGSLLWERVSTGEHFVLTCNDAVVIDEIIADQHPSPLDTLIHQWLESWLLSNNLDQSQQWQAVLQDIMTLEHLDKIFMAQIATHSPGQAKKQD